MFVLFVFRVTQLFANCCSRKKQNKKYDVLPEIPPNGKTIDVKLRSKRPRETFDLICKAKNSW